MRNRHIFLFSTAIILFIVIFTDYCVYKAKSDAKKNISATRLERRVEYGKGDKATFKCTLY